MYAQSANLNPATQDIQAQHRSLKQERALARKEKKKLKSDAKKARKKTASEIEKWSAERKAADKAKKPKGVEKLKIQRDKLRSKAARLEQEGLALLAQAKQAAAECEVLNEKIQVCLAADVVHAERAIVTDSSPG